MARRVDLRGITAVAAMVGLIAFYGVGRDLPEARSTFTFLIPTLISAIQITESPPPIGGTGGMSGTRTENGTVLSILSTADCRISTSILLAAAGWSHLPDGPDTSIPIARFCGSVFCEERTIQAPLSAEICLGNFEIRPRDTVIVLHTVAID